MQEEKAKQKAVHPDAAETLEYDVGEGECPDEDMEEEGEEEKEEEEEGGKEGEGEDENGEESEKDDEHVDYAEELTCELHPNYLEVSAPDVLVDGLDSDNGEGDKNHETKGTHKDRFPVWLDFAVQLFLTVYTFLEWTPSHSKLQDAAPLTDLPAALDKSLEEQAEEEISKLSAENPEDLLKADTYNLAVHFVLSWTSYTLQSRCENYEKRFHKIILH